MTCIKFVSTLSLILLFINHFSNASLHPSPTRKSFIISNNKVHKQNVISINLPKSNDPSNLFLQIPRGGGTLTTQSPLSMTTEAINGLVQFMKGPKSDTLLLLSTTALNTPLCKKFNISPILGFLSLGLLFGPNGLSLIKDVHTTEMLADLGVVLFLFEMGIHLDFKTLMAMKRDVFGIGLGQFTFSALAIGLACKLAGYSSSAMVIIGWSLALSSSAFCLQLLKDGNELSSQYGKSSFGTLLLQDLMVVPLLVITPILAGNGGSVGDAVGKALVQIVLALSAIFAFGKLALTPLFDLVSNSKSQESFIGMILSTVLGMSFLTQGLGLSNTLGAFLSGMLLAETKHRHHVEVEASPFRAILVGIFFFTVGFEIDLHMIRSNPTIVAMTTLGILALKTLIATVVCRVFELPLSTSIRVGTLLSQGGEFAFVAFRAARASGILSSDATHFLATCVSLTMALTPMMESLGAKFSAQIEAKEKKE